MTFTLCTLCTPAPDDAADFERVRQLSWRAAYTGVFAEKLFAEREELLHTRAQSFSEWFAGLDSDGFDTETGTGARRRARIAKNEESEVIGTASTRQVSGEILELESFYLHPEVFGTGVGEALMRDVLPDGEPATLEVLAANPRAIAFYKKHGFTETGKTSKFAGHKTLVMGRNL